MNPQIQDEELDVIISAHKRRLDLQTGLQSARKQRCLNRLSAETCRTVVKKRLSLPRLIAVYSLMVMVFTIASVFIVDTFLKKESSGTQMNFSHFLSESPGSFIAGFRIGEGADVGDGGIR